LHLECSKDEKDELIASLWERKTLGVHEHDLPDGRARLRAFFYGEDAGLLLEEFARYGPELSEEEAKDWTTAWQPYWQAKQVGKRFFLAPSWSDEPTPDGRLRLAMHPGMAFGTGLHPTTQLCLEAAERHLRPGDSVVDIGTGSGILCVGAAMLGAGRIAACDVDQLAVDVAAERLAKEGIRAALFVGSIDAVRGKWASLVLMNISAPLCIEFMPELRRILKPGGTAALSGFLIADFDIIQSAVAIEGLVMGEVQTQEEWGCLVCRRPGAREESSK
jgi:ribosomal protein L11 methyltransferase